jgi:hypothetical protein
VALAFASGAGAWGGGVHDGGGLAPLVGGRFRGWGAFAGVGSGQAARGWVAGAGGRVSGFRGIGALAGNVRSTLVAAPILKEQIGPVRVEGIIAEI